LPGRFVFNSFLVAFNAGMEKSFVWNERTGKSFLLKNVVGKSAQARSDHAASIPLIPTFGDGDLEVAGLDCADHRHFILPHCISSLMYSTHPSPFNTTPDLARVSRLNIRIRKLSVFAMLQAVLLLCGGSLSATLIQWLDATATGSVITNSSGVVTSWLDQSGAGNNALPAIGSVYFPSTSRSASGLAGLDFGVNRNSLTLFSAAASGSWLNCTSNTNGFCVLLAFKCDGLISDWTDLLGNSSTTGTGFFMRYWNTTNNGTYKINLGVNLPGVSGAAAAGNTIIYAFNYNASSGVWTFWDSKGGSERTGFIAAANFSTANAVTLGSTTSANRYINGMIGEVKIFNAALDATQFASERAAMTTKWVTVTDTFPPTPNPAGWATPPTAQGQSSISMTATTGTDPSGVQYFFHETTGNSGGADSGWQASPTYTNSGLSSSTQYGYTVTMRDGLGNTGTASSVFNAATLAPDTSPPTPNPATWATPPTNAGSYSISMTAANGTDPSGVQYFFHETTGNSGGTDSGWQTSPIYTNSGLSPSTQYGYTVTMRDGLGNTGTASGVASAITLPPDTSPPTPNPATWITPPTAQGPYFINMTATTGFDVSGVQYFFHETTGHAGGTDSGWQNSPTYVDVGLSPATQYGYTVTMRDGLGNTGTVSSVVFATTSATNTTAPPNVIIIIADDFGSADVSYQTNHMSDVSTPNLDSLRSQGVSCSRGWITCNVCAPSRLGLMSLQYQNRTGLYGLEAISAVGMPASIRNLAVRLKEDGGYRTGMSGKWHLGENAATNGPVDRGFDEAWYFNSGGGTPFFFTDANYPGTGGYAIYHNRTAMTPDNSYLTDFWTDHAIEFVTNNYNTNFFLYLAYNAVHTPLNWPYNEFDTSHTTRQMITEMGKYMDSCIGRLLTKLDELNIRTNTLIFFISDNGGVYTGYDPATMTSDNRPLRNGKHTDYEGGIRTPFLVSWPAGGIPTNATVDSDVISLDIGPTVLTAAGVSSPTNADGLNLLPILRGQTNALAPRTLFWTGGSDLADNMFKNNNEAWSAVLDKFGYKLVIRRWDMSLFNVQNDISEEVDISTNTPLLVDLFRELIGWQMQMPPHVLNTSGVFNPQKPLYKDAWSFYLPMVDSTNGVLESVEIPVAKGGQYQARVIARYSNANTAVTRSPQPSVTWSLISAIGGSIDANGLFTAGTNDGYVILKAQATFFRTATANLTDFSSYQLIKVGAGSALTHYDIWTISNGLTGVAAAQTADPDGDGANNFYEYTLGGNPTNSTDAAAIAPTARLVSGGGTNWLEYLYNRRNDAAARRLTYSLEQQIDLSSATWSNIGNSAETGHAAKNAEFDSVTNRISTAEAEKFIRLKIDSN
jgi:arylsulfatase A-like enzyme